MADYISTHKSRVSRIIAKVHWYSGLAILAPQYIEMPSTEEEITEAIKKFTI